MRRPFTKEELIDHNPELTAYSREWNDMNARTKGLTGDERKAAMVEFGKRIANSTPVAVAEPKLWAAVVMTRLADGENLPSICQRYAKEAMGIKDDAEV